MYNHYLKTNKLTHKYERINEGDKIKFVQLKEPNPIRDKVIAFPVKLPKEFNLHKYVDYDSQFNKSFLENMDANPINLFLLIYVKISDKLK